MKPTIQLPPTPGSSLNGGGIRLSTVARSRAGKNTQPAEEIVRQSDRFNKSRDFDPSAYGARDLSLLAYGNFIHPVPLPPVGFLWLRLSISEDGRHRVKGPSIFLIWGADRGQVLWLPFIIYEAGELKTPFFWMPGIIRGRAWHFFDTFTGKRDIYGPTPSLN